MRLNTLVHWEQGQKQLPFDNQSMVDSFHFVPGTKCFVIGALSQ